MKMLFLNDVRHQFQLVLFRHLHKIIYMQTIAINNTRNTTTNTHSFVISNTIEKLLEKAEENRLGVVATFILLQVTIAGFNVVIPPMIGAATYIMAPGIILAFLSNAIALAQAKMKWVVLAFLLSMVINAAVSIFCFIQMLHG